MIKADYHTHTTFCDGKNTPEEMVRSALSKGMDAIGFSGHAFVPFDPEASMSPEGTRAYFAEVRRLAAVYEGRIRILCGIEWDLYSEGQSDGFDYRIGSAHYLYRDANSAVDESCEGFERLSAERFSGDYYALCERYYENVASVIDATGADVIGHFDLVTKFNEGDRLFDTKNERYVRAWQTACDRLLETGKPFEINTGVIARGYRSAPYPAKEILCYLGDRGACFLLSSDSHRADSLMYGFEEAARFLSEKGYRLLSAPV